MLKGTNEVTTISYINKEEDEEIGLVKTSNSRSPPPLLIGRNAGPRVELVRRAGVLAGPRMSRSTRHVGCGDGSVLQHFLHVLIWRGSGGKSYPKFRIGSGRMIIGWGGR